MFVCYIHVLLHARRLASADTQLHMVYCILLQFVQWALPLILYAVYCYMFVPWAPLLILYAVYCYMFVPRALLLILYAVYCYVYVPWALLLILYAVYCYMLVPWALLLILYAVYCRMFVPRALPCILLHAVYCRELVLWALLLIVFAVPSHVSFCHRHCIVTVCCMFWQGCIRLHVVYMLLHALCLCALLLYMQYCVVLSTLCTVIRFITVSIGQT